MLKPVVMPTVDATIADWQSAAIAIQTACDSARIAANLDLSASLAAAACWARAYVKSGKLTWAQAAIWAIDSIE